MERAGLDPRALEQTADKLRAICPEIQFGIYSAGLKRRETAHPVIVAGIQSVYRRACELAKPSTWRWWMRPI